MNAKQCISLGAILAFFAVAFGAFGAHGLKNTLTPDLLAIYHTAVDYQLWHAIGLLIIGLIQQQNASRLLPKAAWFMFAGILIFSGSLYALSLSGIKPLGAITPIGGASFLIAWALLAYASFKPK
ncbi:MAG: DUF423 domain-containing protein [Cycloclasticus sp.]|nr:DUF423 domain-containing protein [Cycloclasticus sp.]MBQ0790715.1 DUF423 domain-containing protein [Cycloclasticus sp.]